MRSLAKRFELESNLNRRYTACKPNLGVERVIESRRLEMNGGNPECACGCGRKPEGGKFLPGHDQRLRADLERRVGGLIPLRMLVEAAEHFAQGAIQPSMFNSMVKDVFRMREDRK